jgi:hypothetical protein
LSSSCSQNCRSLRTEYQAIRICDLSRCNRRPTGAAVHGVERRRHPSQDPVRHRLDAAQRMVRRGLGIGYPVPISPGHASVIGPPSSSVSYGVRPTSRRSRAARRCSQASLPSFANSRRIAW